MAFPPDLSRMLVTGMLVILDMGSLFVEDNDGGTTMVICCWLKMGGSPATLDSPRDRSITEDDGGCTERVKE